MRLTHSLLVFFAAAIPATATLFQNAPSYSNTSSATVHWLNHTIPDLLTGTTFGLPWPPSAHYPNTTVFSLTSGDPLHSWITGYWADGSIKFSGHAIGALSSPETTYTVTASSGTNYTVARNASRIIISETDDVVEVDTGNITVEFAKAGSALVKSIATANGNLIGLNGRLVLHSRSSIADDPSETAGSTQTFAGEIANITVDASSVRALVTVKGTHQAAGNSSRAAWLPFTVRFYLYADSPVIKILHSVVFDGNSTLDFISGLGLRFDMPLDGEEYYNRHVRIAGVDGGLFGEAVQGITGLRRDPGEDIRTAQVNGEELPDISTWDSTVSSRLKWIPTWDQYKLSQLTADGFLLKKRTKKGQGWINIPGGTRADGVVYLGGATKGGFALGYRDFWKRYPSGFDVTGAATDTGSLTVWFWSPEAQPLDLRPYHNGLNESGYPDELDALEITYEDWQQDFNTPYGIARTSEVYLFGFEKTPSRETFPLLAHYINDPPFLVAEPKYLHSTTALGQYWSPSTPNATGPTGLIESHLSFLNSFYQNQVNDRRWYGYLDYGDIMHTYDTDRHTWRYDVGGYAWDNSELSPDLFFWQSFLLTGDAHIFRFAEALTRHTSEVDVYHLGQWKGLGTRHGVQHFGDSAKQARISQPQYRKYFFYLSGGDERVGELLEEQLDADRTYAYLDPQRKVRTDGWTPEGQDKVAFWIGTDWSSLAAGWLLEWERRGSRWQEAKTKLINTASGIAALKNGFVTGSALYSLSNWTLSPPPTDLNNTGLVIISHLNAVFGLPEVVSELLHYLGPETPKGFAKAWWEYTYYYLATPAEQTTRYGQKFTKTNLKQAHSRLSAYAAYTARNRSLGQRAWRDFYGTDGLNETLPWAAERITGDRALAGVEEAGWFATNDVAQYGLAAIQNLAYVGEDIPESVL